MDMASSADDNTPYSFCAEPDATLKRRRKKKFNFERLL